MKPPRWLSSASASFTSCINSHFFSSSKSNLSFKASIDANSAFSRSYTIKHIFKPNLMIMLQCVHLCDKLLCYLPTVETELQSYLFVFLASETELDNISLSWRSVLSSFKSLLIWMSKPPYSSFRGMEGDSEKWFSVIFSVSCIKGWFTWFVLVDGFVSFPSSKRCWFCLSNRSWSCCTWFFNETTSIYKSHRKEEYHFEVAYSHSSVALQLLSSFLFPRLHVAQHLLVSYLKSPLSFDLTPFPSS